MKILFVLILTLALCMSCLPMAFAEEAADPTIEEGYTEAGDGFTSVVSWCKNGELNIYGKFYYPEGFDAEKTYPTVIMSHGLGSAAQMVERAKWPQAAVADGFVVYAFDFCGGGRNSKSDRDFMDMSVLTEVSDLNAVMDFVKGQPYVDQGNLFLFGRVPNCAFVIYKKSKRTYGNSQTKP